MSYSDIELEALLDDIESEFSERKKTWKGDAPEKGRQAICAFANDLPGHRKPAFCLWAPKMTVHHRACT